MEKTKLVDSFDQYVQKLNEYEDNRPHYGEIDSEDFKRSGIKELDYKDLESMKDVAISHFRKALRAIKKIEKEIEFQGESQDETVLKLIDIKNDIMQLLSGVKSHIEDSHIDTGF